MLPTPPDVIEEVRAELQELCDANALEPLHIGWAIEQLVEGGVELPLVMATVFDFAPLEWLGKHEREAPHDFDFDALAALLGIDPTTGKPLGSIHRMQPRVKRNDVPPSSRIGRSTHSTTTLGSEGMRQKPLEGWSKGR